MVMSGRANSGKAAAAAMTPEQRKERAMKGVEKKAELAAMPKISHQGELKIGDILIPCYVLIDGRRVLSGRGLQDALRMVDDVHHSQKAGSRLVRLFDNKSLNPFIIKQLEQGHFSPITCYDGKTKISGYEAAVLTDICDAILEARKNGAIKTSRMQIIAEQCELLVRGFARVGLIALIDEATGFQAQREKDALAKILEAFVAKELQPWLKTFPDEFYKQIFRIYGLKYPPEKQNFRPSFIGGLTNNIVYDRLAPELLPELKHEASKLKRKARLHQFLTSDLGHPRLKEHLASLITLLKLSKTPQEFKEKVDLIHPRFGETLEIDFNQTFDGI